MLTNYRDFLLTQECSLVPREISVLCGNNTPAAMMLAKFCYWADIAHNMKDAKERKGWFFKTAVDLKNELGFTRRAYEKARKLLLSLGVLQYRRSGVHGKMHWFVNFEELIALIYEKVYGKTLPENWRKTRIDKDNLQVPEWFPIDAWNEYLEWREEEAGVKKLSRRVKSELVNQVKAIHKKGFDVENCIRTALRKRWHKIYAPDDNSQKDYDDTKVIEAHNAAKTEFERQMNKNCQEAEAAHTPLTEEEKVKASKMASQMLNGLLKKMRM